MGTWSYLERFRRRKTTSQQSHLFFERCRSRRRQSDHAQPGVRGERDKKMMLGQVLVQEVLVTEKQLQRALAEQARKETCLPLGEMCVHCKFLSKADLQKVLRKHRSHIYLGDLLVNLGLLSQEELLQVLEFQQIDGKRIGRLLIEHGLITEANLMNALSMQLGIPRLTPSPGIVQPSVLKGISQAFLVKHNCLPVYQDGDTVEVTNYIITEAVSDGATDIHIEPTEKCLHVRSRIDGILRHKTDLPLALAVPLTSRFKALSGLDIADTRRHQDGRLGARVGSKTYDFRIKDSLKERAVKVVLLSATPSVQQGRLEPASVRIDRDFQHIVDNYDMIGCDEIVTVYDFYKVTCERRANQETAYAILVMELYPANLLECLMDYFRRHQRPVDIETALTLLEKLALLIGNLYEKRGFLFEDIKPEDILVRQRERDFKLVVGDIGGLKNLGAVTIASSQVTPAYCAAEVLRKGKNPTCAPWSSPTACSATSSWKVTCPTTAARSSSGWT